MTITPSTRRTSYDAVPYESFPFPQTHPDRLATLGRLFGLSSPSADRCRVLELGCAAGGNLIPMALTMPQAEFVGVDLSAVQVEQGQRIIADLGLNNIRLIAMSITDIDASFGEFDYILSHGVYSWVPDAVQEALLGVCARQLSTDGIAYISYNTLPGWRMRGMIRDLMRYHAMQFDDPAQRVAQGRAILDFLARSVPTESNAYGMLLQSELDGLRHAPDYYILHEHLEDINEPIYFSEFIERAARHGLAYLAEADFSTMLPSNFAPEVADTVLRIAPDVIRQEQFMDFLRNRTFRQTLLVREDRRIDRMLTPERVMGLWISACLRPVTPAPNLAMEAEEDFEAPNGGQLRTRNAVTRVAVRVLAGRWPAAVAFTDLLRDAMAQLPEQCRQATPEGLSVAEALASDLLQCQAAGLLELHSGPSPFVTRAGRKPLVSPLARLQIRQQLPQVTTLRHEMIGVDANLGRMLQLLDGTRDVEEICAVVTTWALADPATRSRSRKELAGPVRQRVDQALASIARSALLIA